MFALDFEFVSESGANPVPVCLVARELRTGQLIRLWQDELGPEPPFPIDDDTLFVAYFASAEIGCFLELGWPVPTRMLDLYTEFRNATNGIALPGGRGLLGALSHHGISSITSDQKTEERELVMRGGPWSTAERRRILDYCQTDVDPMGALLERMLPGILARPNGLGQALLRGRYMAAVARMERTGVPIDTEMLQRLRMNWGRIKSDLIAAIDKDYGVYEGTTFKAGLFAGYLVDNGIDWPRTATGRLAARPGHVPRYGQAVPQLEPLKELRHALSELRLEKLAVGPGRPEPDAAEPVRCVQRTQHPQQQQVHLRAERVAARPDQTGRGSRPGLHRLEVQEVYIAAQLSGDPALLDAVLSGDPYLAFAKMAGLAPPDATKQSHKAIRDHVQDLRARHQLRDAGAEPGAAHRAVGDRGPGPAAPAGADVPDVHRVGRARRRRRPADAGYLSTVFGWTLRTENTLRSTSLRNFPMQANGAEMLRLACCLATERGVGVCAPVHDALLVEAPPIGWMTRWRPPGGDGRGVAGRAGRA